MKKFYGIALTKEHFIHTNSIETSLNVLLIGIVGFLGPSQNNNSP